MCSLKESYRNWCESDDNDYSYDDCYNCKDSQKALRNASKAFEEIIKVIYNKSPIPSTFEDMLEDCCSYLDVKFPAEKQLQIERKNEALKDIQFFLQKAF